MSRNRGRDATIARSTGISCLFSTIIRPQSSARQLVSSSFLNHRSQLLELLTRDDNSSGAETASASGP